MIKQKQALAKKIRFQCKLRIEIPPGD